MTLTNASIAARCGISERTLYRHYASREVLLNEVATEVWRRLDTPPVPGSLTELLDYPELLFGRFEERSALTRAALQSELFSRLRDGVSASRGTALKRLLARDLPASSNTQRLLTANNLRFLLTATTWNYYRCNLQLSAEVTVATVRLAVDCLLAGLRPA
jgi:AcrR family transcriptional regulator